MQVTVQGMVAGIVSGGVDLLNNSRSDCLLSDRPILIPVEEQTRLSVVQVKLANEPSDPFVVHAGQHAPVTFAWSNFCQPTSGPFSMIVSLPDGGGELTGRIQAPSGQLAAPPACNFPGNQSSMAVGPIMVATD
jgi:hypothetical protein